MHTHTQPAMPPSVPGKTGEAGDLDHISEEVGVGGGHSEVTHRREGRGGDEEEEREGKGKRLDQSPGAGAQNSHCAGKAGDFLKGPQQSGLKCHSDWA